MSFTLSTKLPDVQQSRDHDHKPENLPRRISLGTLLLVNDKDISRPQRPRRKSIRSIRFLARFMSHSCASWGPYNYANSCSHLLSSHRPLLSIAPPKPRRISIATLAFESSSSPCFAPHNASSSGTYATLSQEIQKSRKWNNTRPVLSLQPFLP